MGRKRAFVRSGVALLAPVVAAGSITSGSAVAASPGAVAKGTTVEQTPVGIAVSPRGRVYIDDPAHDLVRVLYARGDWEGSVAGSSAGLEYPGAVAVDAVGDVYVSDFLTSTVKEVHFATGAITTVAGDGSQGYSGDGGPAVDASLQRPVGIALDAAGDLFIADSANNRIREVHAKDGTITTVAGDGAAGYSGDGGPATAARLNQPQAVAVNSEGDVIIADTTNDRIRELDVATGVITTVAGGGAVGTGDGGPATKAGLSRPGGVALDGRGDLYIADTYDNRIREVDAMTGTITTIAGTGAFGYNGTGLPATRTTLSSPIGVAVGHTGDVYIADSSAGVVREIPSGKAIMITVAGVPY